MRTCKLTNYLRTYRKRAGLTQREVAFLLGVNARGPISEIEKRHRAPLLRSALALSSIFGIAVEELFAGITDSVATDIDARLAASARNPSAYGPPRCSAHPSG